MTVNLPIGLVIARMLAVIPIVLLLQAGDEPSATWAFLIFCLAALTDKRSKVTADVRTSQLVVVATEKEQTEVEILVKPASKS